MTNWQITAKTIFCDAVDDEVTLLIYKDYSAHCTGCRKYEKPDQVTLRLIKAKKRRLKRAPKCEGEGCARLASFKQEIAAEKDS